MIDFRNKNQHNRAAWLNIRRAEQLFRVFERQRFSLSCGEHGRVQLDIRVCLDAEKLRPVVICVALSADGVQHCEFTRGLFVLLRD